MMQANNNDLAQNVPISIDSASNQVQPKDFLTSANPVKEGESLYVLREKTRSKLAEFLIYSFTGTVAAIFAIIIIDKTFYYLASDKEKFKEQPGIKDLITLVLTTQSTLVAAALGFYFGARDSR